MDRDHLDDLFAEAIAVPFPDRPRWLDEHCGEDGELRRKLERLLAADAIADGALERSRELLAATFEESARMPERFGVWRVTGALGAGGMGEVWLAERDDGEFTQHAAIKQVAWPTPGLLRRFRNERQILAGLEHPGIARLIDGGVDDSGCPWLAMEYVEGVRITQWLREQQPGVRATLGMVLRICDAVQFAHRNLVVHSDIKPSNILVTGDGAPKLLDFGIATVLAQEGDTGEQTRTMVQLLTPDYAAPELLGGSAVTTAVDVYAMGVLLYELLSGNKPYRLAALADGAPRQRLDEVTIKRPSTAVDPSLPEAKARRRILRGDLDRIVLTAMAREPAHRYGSVEALATDLRSWLAGRPVNARGQDRWYRAGKFITRHRVGFATTLLTFAILLAATVYSVHQARVARAEAARANAVRDFVVGVFEQTDPDARQGNPVTARELLDMGERQLAQEPRSRPFYTEMQGLVGYLHWQVGDFSRGQTMLQGAVAHPDAATPLEVRARNLLYLSESEMEKNLYPAARSHAAEARALALAAGDAGTRIASDARRTYAESLIDDGNARAAEPILMRAIKEDTARFGATSEPVAQDAGLLGSITQSQARYDESLAWLKQSIAAETALHGRVSSEVAMGLLTQAETELYAGDSASAERDAREFVRLTAKLYGPTHARTLSARANLYMVYAIDEHYAEALAGHLELVELTRRYAPERPEQLTYQWDGVALDYFGLGRYEEAVQAARQSLATWAGIESPDPDHASNDARTILAEILMTMGRLDEAETTFKEAIRIEGKNASPDSDSLNRDIAYLGNVYRLQHRHAEAVATTSKALHALSPGTRPTPRRALIELFSAQALLDAGDIDAAAKMAAQARQTGAIAYKHRPLAFSAYQLTSARVALAQRDPTTAETLLREAMGIRKGLPADDPRTVEVQVGLIRALEMQGKHDEAKPLRARVEPVLAASKSHYFADLRQSIDAH